MDVAAMHPAELRAVFRRNGWVRPTSGLARGFVQANLVVLKKDLAFDFLLFCVRNPKPCPVLDVTEPVPPFPGWWRRRPTCGRIFPSTASDRHGELVEETTDIRSHWAEDLVAFLLGCSFTFEQALLANGIPVVISRRIAMCPCTERAFRAFRRGGSKDRWWSACVPFRRSRWSGPSR